MIGDRYSLDREIGRGGMGAVWLGRDEVLGRTVALKRVGVAPGALGPDVKRAEREARIAASLNHPNIVGVFDLVDDGDQQYLVMEYVEGTTLAELVRESGALPQQQAARILAQVASALIAAHANHVVHRDVKPSNILVRSDGLVKLSDFGIARSETDSSLTQTGLVTGSPAYLSPEVASGKLATPASDVWSLGATLFHALAGRPPYDVGDNVLGALYQIVNEPPPRLEGAGEMTPVLLATMAHDPRRRWSIEDVAGVLDLLAASSAPVLPTPTPARAENTQQLRAVEPVAARSGAEAGTPEVQSPTTVEPVTAVAASPGAAPGASGPASARGRRPVLPIIVTLLVLALVGAIVALALQDDPQQTATDPTPAPPTSQTPEPSTPTEPPTSEETTSAGPQAAQIETFIENYLQTASSDPAAGFAQLTPAFQDASGGLERYTGFWGSVSNPRVRAIEADPEALTVTYTYTYNLRGQGQRTEEIGLRLVQDGDRLLIDGNS